MAGICQVYRTLHAATATATATATVKRGGVRAGEAVQSAPCAPALRLEAAPLVTIALVVPAERKRR